MRQPFLFALASTAVALGACTPGPHNLETPIPQPPAPVATTITPTAGPGQVLEPGVAVDPHWWTAFGSEQLNALVDAALTHNSDLAAADATLRQAREQASATARGQGPQADASFQTQRARTSQALATPLADPSAYLYTLHTAQVTVTYPLDLFGAGRNKVRSVRAAAEVAAQRRDAARTTVIANLVLAVIQHASLSAQVDAQQQAIAADRELVMMLDKRRQLGDVGAVDVAAQQTVLATAEGALPTLERQRDHQAALIGTLMGIPAGAAVPELPTLDDLRLPDKLPLSLPAQVIANRPDVRAAEAQVRGAGADLGSAISARLPNITLSAAGGGASTMLSDLLAHGNLFYTLIGGVTQPLFHSGQLLHQQRAAEAALDVAKDQYRSAALQAFLDVSDALSGLQTDATALDAANRAADAASRTLGFTRRQLELGGVGTLALLNASVADLQARIQFQQARAARLTDSVALFQACGAQPLEGK